MKGFKVKRKFLYTTITCAMLLSFSGCSSPKYQYTTEIEQVSNEYLNCSTLISKIEYVNKYLNKAESDLKELYYNGELSNTEMLHYISIVESVLEEVREDSTLESFINNFKEEIKLHDETKQRMQPSTILEGVSYMDKGTPIVKTYEVIDEETVRNTWNDGQEFIERFNIKENVITIGEQLQRSEDFPNPGITQTFLQVSNNIAISNEAMPEFFLVGIDADIQGIENEMKDKQYLDKIEFNKFYTKSMDKDIVTLDNLQGLIFEHTISKYDSEYIIFDSEDIIYLGKNDFVPLHPYYKETREITRYKYDLYGNIIKITKDGELLGEFAIFDSPFYGDYANDLIHKVLHNKFYKIKTIE